MTYPANAPLFGNWLTETRALQSEAYERDLWGLEGAERGDAVVRDFTAMIVELGEMMQEFPGYKDWITDRSQLNRKQFIAEAVDVLHFFGNILNTVRCTDEELTAAYWHKMNVNRVRMASSTYDGVTDKCSVCHRELIVGVCPDLSHRTGVR